MIFAGMTKFMNPPIPLVFFFGRNEEFNYIVFPSTRWGSLIIPLFLFYFILFYFQYTCKEIFLLQHKMTK